MTEKTRTTIILDRPAIMDCLHICCYVVNDQTYMSWNIGNNPEERSKHATQLMRDLCTTMRVLYPNVHFKSYNKDGTVYFDTILDIKKEFDDKENY